MPSATSSRRGAGRTQRFSAALGFLVLLIPLRASAAAAVPRLQFYGTYSLGTKAGADHVDLEERVAEARRLGANMIVGTGGKEKLLDVLPDGMLAVPGCSLMKRRDWQKDGRWDEAQARARLSKLARRFGTNPKVYGVCITHEVTEYADHAHRVWMYRLAKEYFPDKKVIQYYGVLWDTQNPRGDKVQGYGEHGERETDILFVSLPAVAKKQFSKANVRRLEDALAAATRTPEIPVWGQTSINADNKMVSGPETMLSVWGAHGENMSVWADTLFATARDDAAGHTLRLSGFFWRSLGRFKWDLGYPAFADHRTRMQTIGRQFGPKT